MILINVVGGKQLHNLTVVFVKKKRNKMSNKINLSAHPKNIKVEIPRGGIDTWVIFKQADKTRFGTNLSNMYNYQGDWSVIENPYEPFPLLLKHSVEKFHCEMKK